MADTTTTGAGAGDGGPAGKKGKDANRRKMLIYGGLAAVMLVVYLMSRSSASSAANSANNSGTAADTSGTSADTGAGDLGSGAGGIDPSADIGNVDSDLQELSQQIAAEQTGSTSTGGADPNIAAIGSILSGFTTPSTTNVYYAAPVAPGPGGGAAAAPKSFQPAVQPAGQRPRREVPTRRA